MLDVPSYEQQAPQRERSLQRREDVEPWLGPETAHY